MGEIGSLKLLGSVGLALFALFAASGWGWGVLTLCGRFPSRDPDRLLAYPLVGLLAIAGLGSILWITGGFVAAVAWSVGGLGGLLGLWGWARDGRAAARAFRATVENRIASTLLWGGAFLLVLPICLSPDPSWDSGAYHLVIPREAAEEGALPLAVDHPFLFGMYSTHTLLGWGYLWSGSGTSVTGRLLLAAMSALALALATRRVGRRFHPRIGLITLALVLSTPLLIVQWGTALPDLVVFAAGAAGLALATLGGERRWLWVGMSALGFAAASKHFGVIVAMGLASIWIAEGMGLRRPRRFAHAAALGVICLASAGPWFLKNTVAFGNPLTLDIGGEDPAVMAQHKLFPDADIVPSMDREKKVDGLLPARVLKRIASGFPWASSLSPLLFFWWPFALAGARPRWWWGGWLGATVVFGLYVIAVPELQSYSPARYFFNVAPFAYFLAAVGWDRWVGSHSGRASAAWALFLAVSLPTWGLTAVRAARRLPVLSGQQTTAAYWAERDPAAPLIAELNAKITDGDLLFFVGERVNLLRIPRRNLMRPYQARWAGVSSAEDLRTAWDRWGVTHVLVNDGPGEKWDWGVKRAWVTNEREALKGWRCVAESGTANLYERCAALD